MIICGIYAIVNKATGEWYGGQSIDIPRRVRQHWRQLARRASPFRRLQEDYDTHGPDAFTSIVLEACPPEALDAREQAYLDAGFAVGAVYNNATRAGWPPKGHRWSDESRVACGERMTARVATTEGHQRLVEGLAKRSPEWREKAASRFRGWTSDPERVSQHREAMAARSANKEWKADRQRRNREMAADPAWRAAIKAGQGSDGKRRKAVPPSA